MGLDLPLFRILDAVDVENCYAKIRNITCSKRVFKNIDDPEEIQTYTLSYTFIVDKDDKEIYTNNYNTESNSVIENCWVHAYEHIKTQLTSQAIEHSDNHV